MLSRTQVIEWFRHFKRGEMSVEDHARSGHPSTSRTDENVEKIRLIINDVRRFTIDQISKEAGVSWTSCQRILTEDFQMRRVSAKFVPRLITQDQINIRLNLSRNFKKEIKSDPSFLTKVITGDESWCCYGYDPETKQATSQWKKKDKTKKRQDNC